MVSGLEYGEGLDNDKLWQWLGGDPRAPIPAPTAKAKKAATAGPKRGRKHPLSANGEEAPDPSETADPSEADPSGPPSAAAEDPSADRSGPCQMDVSPDKADDQAGNKANAGEAQEGPEGVSGPGVSGEEAPSEAAVKGDVMMAEAEEAVGADEEGMNEEGTNEAASGAALGSRSSPAPAALEGSGSGAVNLKPFPPLLFLRQAHHILDRKT